MTRTPGNDSGTGVGLMLAVVVVVVAVNDLCPSHCGNHLGNVGHAPLVARMRLCGSVSRIPQAVEVVAVEGEAGSDEVERESGEAEAFCYDEVEVNVGEARDSYDVMMMNSAVTICDVYHGLPNCRRQISGRGLPNDDPNSWRIPRGACSHNNASRSSGAWHAMCRSC